ncbi:unnamed protein product [Acanthoscelides obtectus]|uniref:Tc1-like transposase DDE domain-containing protein n=1 Tax=Acanthoscelides obtectus TaxID=200917 RepID=A0A9P0PZ75_ACAOB|nr:unnamed protein product [Acanthoscelides obtectus]CAK1682213.1 Mariner Mos1 transposase [Acanthoscelides obtectus]
MPFLFSNQELADIHFVFLNRRHPTRTVFVRVHRQIIENGFGNLQRDQNINVRQRRFTRMILREFDRDPTTSVRRVSGALGISASHVHRVLRNDHRRPYHLQPVQGLQPGDGERRITFCQWILDKTDNNREFLSNVLWTDESCFIRRGVVNFHNQHIWSHENPHAVRERNFQHEFSVNVWIGIYRNRLFGPNLLPARLNAATFLEFLKAEHANMWDDVMLDLRRLAWFQLDGCPTHYSRIVRNWLDENYPERWIGRGGPVAWPPRSPDLNPLDFFVWGFLKEKVYQTPVTTRDMMLIDIIRNACDKIRPYLNNAYTTFDHSVTESLEKWNSTENIIYYNFQRQLSQQECLPELLSVFGKEAPHHLSDDPMVGAQKTAVTQENVDAVRKLIIEDRHKISKTSIQTILHEELGVRKLFSRWIPHLLTEEQKTARVNWCQKTLDRFNSGNSKNVYSIVSGDESWIYCYEPENKRQTAVWVFQGEEKPTKVVATFVSKAGHIATIPLNEQRTVTADWYTTICLPKVITELRKINPERRIILYQDNASSHTAQKRRQYLTEENVELLDHPPYSSDLSPNDFFTFPKIKNRLHEEAVDAFKNAVLDLPANEWNKCFENWFERMQMCINLRTSKDNKTQIRPMLEYCSLVWGAAAPTTLFMLDAVQSRAVQLIDDPFLTDSLGTLPLFHDVPAIQTRLTLTSHPNRVELRTSRTGRYDRSFVPRRIDKTSSGSS